MLKTIIVNMFAKWPNNKETQLFSWNCGHQFLKEMNNITNNTISNI